MAVTFIIFYSIGLLTRKALEKRIQNRKNKKIHVANPRGGANELDFFNDDALAELLLTCVADNTTYAVSYTHLTLPTTSRV